MGTSLGDQAGPLVPALVLGLIVILGVGGIALLTGRRQAEEQPSPDPDTNAAPPAPAFVQRAAAVAAPGADQGSATSRPRAPWEIYTSLDNEPLGSVDEVAASSQAHPRDSAEGGEARPGDSDQPSGFDGERHADGDEG